MSVDTTLVLLGAVSYAIGTFAATGRRTCLVIALAIFAALLINLSILWAK